MAKNSKKDQENEGLQAQIKIADETATEMAPLVGENRRLIEEISKVHDELQVWKQKYVELEDIVSKNLSARE